METNIAISVETAELKAKYDTGLKAMLADKQILARMISSQKEVEFTKSNYDDIKAVKSI